MEAHDFSYTGPPQYRQNSHYDIKNWHIKVSNNTTPFPPAILTKTASAFCNPKITRPTPTYSDRFDNQHDTSGSSIVPPTTESPPVVSVSDQHTKVYIFADSDGEGQLYAFKSLKDADEAYLALWGNHYYLDDSFQLRLFGDFNVVGMKTERVWVTSAKYGGCYDEVQGVFSTRAKAEAKANTYITNGEHDEEVLVEMVTIK